MPVPGYVGKQGVTLSRQMLPEEAMVLLARKGKNIKLAGTSQHEALRSALEQRGLMKKDDSKFKCTDPGLTRLIKHLLS